MLHAACCNSAFLQRRDAHEAETRRQAAAQRERWERRKQEAKSATVRREDAIAEVAGWVGGWVNG
jgi:hypothetical protein